MRYYNINRSSQYTNGHYISCYRNYIGLRRTVCLYDTSQVLRDLDFLTHLQVSLASLDTLAFVTKKDT